MSSFTKEKFWNSRQAYNMLREVAIQEGPYTSKIADEIGTSYHALKKYIDYSLELNLISKAGKDGRKQLYELNYPGLSRLFGDLVIEEIVSHQDEGDQDLLKAEVDMHMNDSSYDVEEALHRDFPVLLGFYVEKYLQNIEDSTLKEMLFEDFFLALERSAIDRYNAPKWLYALKALGRRRFGWLQDPKDIFMTAFLEYQGLPDTIEKEQEPHDPDTNVDKEFDDIIDDLAEKLEELEYELENKNNRSSSIEDSAKTQSSNNSKAQNQ